MKFPVQPIAPPRLHGLAPQVTDATVLLVLGSFPGAASLAAQQYYAHPQNQFWRIFQAIWPSGPRQMDLNSYENRIRWLLERGVGVWDVYATCERQGSLDSAIRQPEVNDFSGLHLRCPQLRVVAHNGAESFRHARQVALPGVHSVRLPSTSPAHASWRFERKLEAWRAVVEMAGLA
ncbi:MAG: DNA-deoxyinosine glycosylase [Betaproteobacteria bacterium HGW-Betaproteobacteria-3]|nr:MAG: DNA-deoxyinosine glycosylase [Betaproteobacteria bacterium HGW-Betaproteobacteria-3]